MKLTDLERTEFLNYLNAYPFSSDIRGKTFLITGSKGIVGSGIIKWLLLENELHGTGIRILASTRNPSAIPDYIEEGDDVTYCRFGQEDEIGKVDYIIHAAAPTGKDVFISQPVESLHVILDETERMLRLATGQHCPIVYLSSEEAYGLTDSDYPVTEEYVGAVDSLDIRSCYPLGKKTAELLCHSYHCEYGTDVRILRPTVIQGLLQPYESNKVENEILHCIIEGHDFVMKSAGLTKKSMIYSLDAVSAILTVLFRGVSGEVYNATNPATFMAVCELAKTLFKRFAPGQAVRYAGTDTAQTEGYLPQRALLEDIHKIGRLGWNPLANLEHIYDVDIQRFRDKQRREEQV